MTGPLRGLKVLDFTRVLAGPHFTKMLCDMGAQVVKVEDPETGDISRFGFPVSGIFSHYYAQQNAGKKCLSLDLNTSAGREIIKKLCKDVDIVAENFRPGTLKPFGLDYLSVRKINKKIIYVSVSGYGQTGPLRGKPAFPCSDQFIERC